MKNLNKFKAFLIKNIADRFNNIFYPYFPPQLPTQEQIDKMPSLDTLEAEAYQDTLNRIDPDGIYHYRWHPELMNEKGECIPDSGDMLLHQGILLGAISLRMRGKGEGGVQFKTFDAILSGIERFIEDGYLIRGKCRYKKVNGIWIVDIWKYADKVSGDQLAGFCFGVSLAYHLHPERFPDSLKQKILSFTDRMIDNKMMLQERDGSAVIGSKKNWFDRWWTSEIPYDSWRILEGHVTTKLALLSLAYKISDKRSKYLSWYEKLINEYSFDSLAEYSSIFFGSLNNFFGANICALNLFAIGFNMGFPDYVKRGLKRIAHQTRDYGYAIFDLLANFSEDTVFYGGFEFENEIKKRLYSYFIPCGEDIFKRSIFFFGGKKRVSALTIRARNREDLIFSRCPFDDRNNMNPDLWALNNTGMDDFLIEYWLAKYLQIF